MTALFLPSLGSNFSSPPAPASRAERRRPGAKNEIGIATGMSRRHAIALGAAKWVLGVSLATGFALSYPTPVWAHTDGPLEDDPGWSCVDDGNRVCGPGNAQGAPAGCYDDGGVLWATWPCRAWTPADGYRHGDGSVTR